MLAAANVGAALIVHHYVNSSVGVCSALHNTPHCARIKLSQPDPRQRRALNSLNMSGENGKFVNTHMLDLSPFPICGKCLLQ